MKKVFCCIIILFLIAASPFKAYAEYEDYSNDYGAQSLYDELPDESKKSLSDIGLDKFDISSLNNLSFDKIITEILGSVAEQSSSPLKLLAVIIAVMLLYSLLYGIKTSIDNSSMQQVMSICVTLCVTGALVTPVMSVINDGIDTVKTASSFMLAYLPVMLAVMTASGRAVSGGAYYAMMTFLGQAVNQVSANIVLPFLKLFTGLSIASAVSPSINLSGFTRCISKLAKWILGFIMALFSSVLTLRQLISVGLDSVGTRAVKFTLSSLVPVVGSALSEAYKTVEGSVGLLKSGIGVFAIIAVFSVFLPIVLRCLLWLFVLWVSKAAGELMNLREPCLLLESISGVISTILAVILCVAAVFIISTASVLIIGGTS